MTIFPRFVFLETFPTELKVAPRNHEKISFRTIKGAVDEVIKKVTFTLVLLNLSKEKNAFILIFKYLNL